MSLQIYKAQSTVFPLVTEFPSWLYIFWQVETTFCPFIHIHDLPGPYNPSGDAGQILLMESPAQESPKMSLWRCCRMPFQNLHKSRALPRQGECRFGSQLALVIPSPRPLQRGARYARCPGCLTCSWDEGPLTYGFPTGRPGFIRHSTSSHPQPPASDRRVCLSSS